MFSNGRRPKPILQAVWLLAIALPACGPKLPDTSTSSEEQEQATARFADALAENDSSLAGMTKIFLNVAGEEMGLGLAAVGSWIITVDQCASGYSVTADATTPNISLYDFDQNCVGKLEQFTSGGFTYIPKVGYEFQNWSIGEYAVFENTLDPNDTYYVRVDEQLSSPLNAGDAIQYNIAATTKDISDHSFLGVLRLGENEVTSKPSMMRWVLYESRILIEDSDLNTFRFAFVFECFNRINRPDKPQQAYCNSKDLPLKDLTYLLMEDTFNGVPCTTSAECASFFDGSELSVNMSTDFIPPGAQLKNGGFTTKTDPTQALLGPANIATNNGMIILLQINGEYGYFSVQLETQKSFN